MTKFREAPVDLIEAILDLEIPNSYRGFLLERQSAVIDGFKIMGFARKQVPMSVLEGTLLLRNKLGSLQKNLIALSFNGTRALCMDLGKANQDDAPLVEVDLVEKGRDPTLLGKTFKEWIEEHERVSKRFTVAWNRIRARQAEEGYGVGKWKAIVNRVRDYIIGVAACKYSDFYGCLEVDEFYPVDQPHIKKGIAVRILVNEIFARARDYSGSLKIIFTKDTQEDESGRIRQDPLNRHPRRIPRPVPDELTNLAKSYGISLKEAEKGIISHQEAVDLWFCLLDLPNGVKGRVYELEKAGYLSREILTEVITTDIWSREEVTWIFQNAPRPEALILGTDLPEQRPFYAESLNWGRAAFLACRFQQAIMAELTGGLSVEEIEKTEVKCTLEPVESFWVLKCNQKFPLPLSWMLDKLERTPEVEPGKAVLFSCRPILPTYFKSDKDWIKREIKLLRRHKTKTKFRCLLFSYEFISPDYKGDIDEVKKLVKKAARKGVTILFAPSRMGLYLDDEIQRRMLRARRLKQFPSRKAGLKLRIIETPREWWNGTDASLICRRIQNASQAAEVFAEQIVRGRDVNQYRMEFSLMCDVIETEALKSHNIIADVEGQDSENLLEALQSQDSRCHGVTFPYIRPDKMPSFRERLKSRRLRSILRKVKGGLVVTTKPWEHFQIPITMAPVRIGQTFKIPASIIKKVDTEIVRRNRERLYVNRWQTIERAHEQLRQAFRDGVPFSMASFEGRIRSAVFIEMIKDYIYSSGEAKSTELFIAYSDGSASQAFPLFSLPEIKRPLGRLFHYPVGLVSLRHMEVDQLTERALVRNREIQLCETGAEQEILAFRRTSECIDEFVRFLRREIEESQLSLSLNTLLTRRAELRNEKWDGLEMPIYHATGLEPAGIGAYRAVLEMLKKYRGQLIVIPQIYFKGIFRPAEEWY